MGIYMGVFNLIEFLSENVVYTLSHWHVLKLAYNQVKINFYQCFMRITCIL